MRVACGVLCIVVWAASAFAQGPITDRVRLELRLVSQFGTPSNPASPVTSFDVQSHPDTTSPAGVPRRIEVQYRLVTIGVSAPYVPAGLASGSLRIRATGATLQTAVLSQAEARFPDASPLPPPWQSVNLATDITPISGDGITGPFTGLHAPFRTGLVTPLPGNSHPDNGVLDLGGTLLRDVRPRATAQSDQNDGGWYGLYSFNMLPTGGAYSIDVAMDADPTSGERFRFFDDGQVVPIGGTVVTGDSINFIPAPGSAVVFGLAILGVHRRRS